MKKESSKENTMNELTISEVTLTRLATAIQETIQSEYGKAYENHSQTYMKDRKVRKIKEEAERKRHNEELKQLILGELKEDRERYTADAKKELVGMMGKGLYSLSTSITQKVERLEAKIDNIQFHSYIELLNQNIDLQLQKVFAFHQQQNTFAVTIHAKMHKMQTDIDSIVAAVDDFITQYGDDEEDMTNGTSPGSVSEFPAHPSAFQHY